MVGVGGTGYGVTVRGYMCYGYDVVGVMRPVVKGTRRVLGICVMVAMS